MPDEEKRIRTQFTIHLGADDDSNTIRKWFDEFFELENGRLGNKVSDHVRQAIVKGFSDSRIQLDPRKMIDRNKEKVDAEG